MHRINLTIDNRQIEAEEGSTILANCQKLGIDIPTLCYYKALKPYGGCRLCVVEAGPGLCTSCTTPVAEGMIVRTDTPKVFHARQTVLRLLLLSAPNAERIKELAEQYGVAEDRFKPDDTNCILCGLCTRICGELMGTSAIGLTNRGAKKEVLTPFGEISPACTVCGACSFICPTGKIKLDKITDKEIVPRFSEFDKGMGRRPNIFLPYPQAVPNVPVLDKTNCPHFLWGKCGACQTFCEAGAIDYEEKDTVETKDIGAVIVQSGFDTFDAARKGEYGYGRYPNVITNLQFERLLSSSGPTAGEIMRPSDGEIPHRIAFIQCVGSRELPLTPPSPHGGEGMGEGGVEYCCSIGCMASTKEAIIAKEHHKEIDATIFFIDMRAFGKDFDKYYENAKAQYGVRYIRSQISKIYQKQETKNLVLKYVPSPLPSPQGGEGGMRGIVEEEFNLVILVTGLVPPAGTKELADQLGLSLNEYGFLAVEPKDIPETVVIGSSAAAEASELLAGSRWTLTKKKEYPPEKDVSEEDLRVGVIVCRCGRNIASVVNVPEVKEFAATLPNVVYADEFLYSCSADSLVRIKEKIKEHNLNRVVVASCTPRTHDPLFRDTIREAGLNPCLFDMASIREHCSWVHMDMPKEATEKAKALTAMAVAKARLMYPVKRTYSDVIKKALVIGGGISGMTAALSIARQGFSVHLVEREHELGGHLSKIYYTLGNTDPQALFKKTIEEVKNNPLIKVYCDANIKEVKGFVGNFKTIISTGAELEHGAIIVATGAEEHKPSEYLYGQDPRILLQDEFEEKIRNDPDIIGVPRSEIRNLQSVVMIQCVESREEKRPYCSRICCSTAIKNAIRFKDKNPDANVYILYRDIRTYGFMEKYYKEAREKGVVFILFEKEDKPKVEINPVRSPPCPEGTAAAASGRLTSNGVKNNKILITMKDPMMKRRITLNPDILVLNTGMDPRENEELSKVLKIPRNEDKFFLEAHAKIRPLDFSVEGVFFCGTCHSPRHIEESITQAKGAAMRAVTILAKDKLEGKAEVACVKERLCRGCGLCVEVCPYSAREIDEATKTAKVLETVCQGCGACAAVCPSGATEHLMFEKKQIIEMIEEAVQ